MRSGWCAALSLALLAAAGRAEVLAPERAAGPVRFGAAEVRAALRAKGSTLRVVVAEQGDPLWSRVAGQRIAVPAAPESFAISALGGAVAVEGRDAAGAMYGALELAGEIASGDIRPGAKSPFLEVRGVNAFLTTQALEDPGSWFWSDSYWRSYLDMLARTRHNFLDLHGPFDLTVDWASGFSYFVWLPEFAEVGVGRERAAKNLARFREILRMAADRGVKVGYMNYASEAPLGPWKAGRFHPDEQVIPKDRRPPYAAGFLPASRLERYTREAAAVFLKALPELWMFGFRVGESGQAEDFYRKTYLEALKSAPESLNVYTRTWLADPVKVREIAASLKNRFFIEPKFNGEHLGLPYQAVTGGRVYPASGSYEDYTNYPRPHSTIWQIRAHGTHRVFRWGRPEFARRTVRSCKFGGGAGFSMEPPNAYCPETDYLHNNPALDHNFFEWKHQQDWYWYMLWGLTAYDPDVPERVWVAEFERRFGPRAGRLVFDALAESGRVVPFIFAYHSQGLDHYHMAPELETGDHQFRYGVAYWQGERMAPYRVSLKDFLEVGTLDRTAMADPAGYVAEHLGGAPTGRMNPWEAGEYLGSAAAKSEALIREAARLEPAPSKEFACIRMDVEAVAALGRYWRDRILSATHLEFYNRTGHRPELSAAHRYLASAAAEWDRLADAADGHYGHVPESIRMRTFKFRWKEEGRNLGVVLAELNRLESEFRNPPGGRIAHVPPRQAMPGKAMRVCATAAPDRPLTLLYKRPGAPGYTEASMRIGRAGLWEGEIPAEAAAPGTLEYYFEAAGAPAQSYGSTLERGVPYAVRVSADRSKPAIAHRAPAGRLRGPAVTVEARVTDHAGVASVAAYYKRMPSRHDWIKVPMSGAGAGIYRAELPLTSEGILYWFEAVDANGSAANHPDFLERTPYYVIEGWDPRRP